MNLRCKLTEHQGKEDKTSQPINFAMDITSHETFQQLLEEIKKMNVNLEAASFAINDLTMQLHKTTSVDSVLPPTKSSNTTDGDMVSTAKTTPCIDALAHGDQATSVGYVNWNESHEILSEQHLVEMIHIRSALKKLQSIATINKGSKHSQQIAKYKGYDEEEDEEEDEGKKTENGLFLFQYPIPRVGKENRFPQNAVYVDVNSPQLQLEMCFMNKLFVPPTDGVVERFIKIVESEMQTCSSFEKQHGLKWV